MPGYEEEYINMLKDLIGRLKKYSIEDEIYNLDEEDKIKIIEYMKIFTHYHILNFGYIGDDNYNLFLTLEILNHLGVELDIGYDVSDIDEYEFKLKNVIRLTDEMLKK